MAAPQKLSHKEKKEIADFLSDRKVLVVDESSSCRSNISRALVSLGAKTANLLSVPSFEQGEEEISDKKPPIVIADYNIGRRCGLELQTKLREVIPSTRDRFFILATGNTSESTVAEAAEEDVDSFICKPFTGNSLQEYLLTAIRKKIKPSEYILKIETGKSHLKDMKLDNAEENFKSAKSLNQKPALACYYVGETSRANEDLEIASEAYNEGLKHNPQHYKCLVGKYESLEKLGKKEDAYQTVKVLSSYFPVSPQRLGKILQLAVYTYNFEDLNQYYDIFTKLSHRTDILVKTVSAALIVAGRYLSKKDRLDDAVEVYNKAVISSQYNPKVIRQVVLSLIAINRADDATAIMKKYPSDETGSDEFRSLDFLIANATETLENVILIGRKLLDQGMKHLDVYRVMIQRYKEYGKPDAAESLMYDAVKAFPDHKDEFEKLNSEEAKAA